MMSPAALVTGEQSQEARVMYVTFPEIATSA